MCPACGSTPVWGGMEGKVKRLPPTSTMVSPYDSTCADQQGVGDSRSTGVCRPEVKQVEVICHLMHADFFLPFFFSLDLCYETSGRCEQSLLMRMEDRRVSS